MLYLKQLFASDGLNIYNMLQDIEASDNGFNNAVKNMTYDEYLLWLKKRDNVSRGLELESWMVPETYYWLFDGEVPVGHGKIRHFLNENLEKHSGHIGYAVAVSQRGKGYGNELLRLLLSECGKKDITTVQIGANKDNTRSNKVILHNGGVLVKETENKNIYHIKLIKRA